MKENILKAFSEWTGDDKTEKDFNEYMQKMIYEWGGDSEPLEIDNIINNVPNTKFEYTTWLCDRNSDDFVIHISVALKGGYSLMIDNMAEIPFETLLGCIKWIEKTNKRVDDLRITNYPDIGGDKTQIIIDHNVK